MKQLIEEENEEKFNARSIIHFLIVFELSSKVIELKNTKKTKNYN